MGGFVAPGAPVRQLHVVGFTSDHAGLVLAVRREAKTGSYILALDSRLIEQIETARRVQRGGSGTAGPGLAPGGSGSRVGSALNPREIQARLRSGRSVAEVAAEAGVGTDWIDRFAAPILAEQAAAIERAGRLPVQTSRRGTSERPLASSVVRNLADRGVRMTGDEFADAWSACHLVDRDWLVRFTFTSRGHALEAEWTLDTATGTLMPRNPLGAELGFVGAPREAPVEVELTDRSPAPAARPAPRPGRPKRILDEEAGPAPPVRRRGSAASKNATTEGPVAKVRGGKTSAKGAAADRNPPDDVPPPQVAAPKPPSGKSAPPSNGDNPQLSLPLGARRSKDGSPPAPEHPHIEDG
jgi:hypothetical protein